MRKRICENIKDITRLLFREMDIIMIRLFLGYWMKDGIYCVHVYLVGSEHGGALVVRSLNDMLIRYGRKGLIFYNRRFTFVMFCTVILFNIAFVASTFYVVALFISIFLTHFGQEFFLLLELGPTMWAGVTWSLSFVFLIIGLFKKYWQNLYGRYFPNFFWVFEYGEFGYQPFAFKSNYCLVEETGTYYTYDSNHLWSAVKMHPNRLLLTDEHAGKDKIAVYATFGQIVTGILIMAGVFWFFQGA